LIGRAEAQLQTLPSWAVTDFVDQKNRNSKFGQIAAEAVSSELAKTQVYDVQPQESVARALDTLTLQKPVTDVTSLMRLAQELRVTTIVRGEVIDYAVRRVSGGKQASVVLRTVAVDAASGLDVNGATVQTTSTLRAGDVPDETLIAEAIGVAAAKSVQTIRSNTLPTGTVLNTFQDTALINQGTRTGFAVGQQVIVTRGREQVSVAVVQDVDPDQATVKITRVGRGIQPGDKVRVVFTPPPATGLSNNWNDANPKPKGPRASHSGPPNGFFSLALVLALGVILLGGGNSNGQGASADVISEATLFPDPSGVPAVKVSWSPNMFSKGNSQRFAWQVWRNDFSDSPVIVVPGGQTFAYDTNVARTNLVWYDFAGVIGGSVCNNSGAAPLGAPTNPAGVVPGRAYLYQVSLVYKVNSVDLPDGSTGGNGGSSGGIGGNTASNGGIGGNTGTTGTTGTTGNTGNTGNTGGTTGTDCYFETARDTARGVATPLNRLQLQSPAEGEAKAPPSPGNPINDDITFIFQSAVTSDPISVQYAVEVSTSPNFTKSTTKVLGTRITPAPGTVSITTSNNFLTAQGTIIWWRVGARNVADNPGPTKDQSGQRYVWGPGRSFNRPGSPPPPPASEVF